MRPRAESAGYKAGAGLFQGRRVRSGVCVVRRSLWLLRCVEWGVRVRAKKGNGVSSCLGNREGRERARVKGRSER